jgi:hypothetical protein
MRYKYAESSEQNQQSVSELGSQSEDQARKMRMTTVDRLFSIILS